MSTFALLLGATLGIGLLLCGLEIAIALGIGSLAMLVALEGTGSLRALSFVVWGSMNSATLSALPLFILMAEILLVSGISNRFYDGMSRLLVWLPGRLLQTNIAGSALFSAISGSSIATAAALGGVAIPRQMEEGYDASMSCGAIAAGGTLGILIPPSIIMIIYASFTEVPVIQLFTAGIVPGLMLTAIFMVYIAIRTILNPSLVPARPAGEGLNWHSILTGLREIAPVVALMLFVLGSIYAGFATPTEAAALGALAAAVVGLVVGQAPLRRLGEALMSAVVTSTSILLIVMSAFIFSYAVEITGVARNLADYVQALDLNIYVFFAVIILVYLVLGCLIDSISMVVLTVPLLVPMLIAFQIDFIWFGILLVLVMEIGLITPPVGMNLFVVDSISRAGFGTVIRGAMPYVLIMIVFLLLLIVFPGIATWLPSHV